MPLVDYQDCSITTFANVVDTIRNRWDIPKNEAICIDADSLADEHLFAASSKMRDCMKTYHQIIDVLKPTSEHYVYDLDFDNEGHIQMYCGGYNSLIDEYVLVNAGKLEDLQMFKEYVNLNESNTEEIISFMKKLENIIDWEKVEQDILNSKPKLKDENLFVR